ncbi:hypothetical protein SAMN05660206_10326 [Sphingobacterium wenxiniae]|uniref:Uncharacterized protein n=1 Tax=Sphingobacterium wenxiniae TaxID=683125 RepID=A0A1I6R220_9SPHI|nr:hypothetical protein SAMN05660206_10326 [Sphingobacterium wenxiniae]
MKFSNADEGIKKEPTLTDIVTWVLQYKQVFCFFSYAYAHLLHGRI